MSFKEFDLRDYINALEHFKSSQTDEVIKHWGSIEAFNDFIQRVKDKEENIAKIAIQQFGSIEKYTESMEHNWEHFSEIMEEMDQLNENQEELHLPIWAKATGKWSSELILTKPSKRSPTAAMGLALLNILQKH